MKQSNTKVIGITGGIATGKSTVSNIIRNMGYPVIDADEVSREVVEINEPAYKDIIKLFGEEILGEDKEINRVKLGNLIFNSEELRSKLNGIVHPRVYERIRKYIYDLKTLGNELIFVDIPLLIEVKDRLIYEGIIFDEIWLIYTDAKIQLNRLKERNNYSKEEALVRINSQMPINNKMKYCDRIIDNSRKIDFTVDEIKKSISEISME